MDTSKLFAGKRVLITGGSRGIGAATARRLGALGAHVGVGYRSEAGAAEDVAADVRAAGGNAVTLKGDVAVPADIEALVEGAHKGLGGLDVVINCAGIMQNALLGDITADHCRAILDTNVTAVALLTKAAARVLSAPGGRIVHISSRLAYGPMPSTALYSASKAAVSTLVHTFAKELGPRGITINAVAPGIIETDMTAASLAARRDGIIAQTPLARIGQPDDIAGIAIFLASPESGWITGRTIIADGGLQ